MKFVNLVNIKQGTDSCRRFSNGNTLPLVQLPFGFASFAPQTNQDMGNWFYHPSDRSFEGVRLTRQPSVWIGEQGGITIMPQHGIPMESPRERWSGIRPEDAVLTPYYMKYDLLRVRAVMELTPTNSGACIKVTYRDTTRDNFISVLPIDNPCHYEVKENMILGYTDCVSTQKPRKNAKIYFVLSFNDGDLEAATEKNGALHIKVKNPLVEFKLSTSLISTEQALINMKKEHNYTDFKELKFINESIWEEYLSRIEIKTDDEEIMRTFYSCMYRFLLYPNRAYELDEQNNPIHYSPGKDCVCPGYHYTNNGFWDTYRTVYSLLPYVDRDEYEKIIESFIIDYKEDGWLPRWTATEPKNCMPSTGIDPVLADAVRRGALSGELAETALEAMIKHANVTSDDPVFGRLGCEAYLKYGYVPDTYPESVNLTLDAAYGDWCIAEIAKELGKDDIAKEYYMRSKNYENIFDKKTGFMRAKNEQGKMSDTFYPESWSMEYTEASAYQTSLAVQHDLDGLCKLHGGREKFLKKLDEVFQTPPVYLTSDRYQNCEVHEMTEMAAADWGQCAISNQPSFHIPFIYAYLGEVEKTNYWVEKICREGFSYGDDGFPGDEDNGTMAAFYMFCVMGFYPLTPGKAEFIRFKGLAENVTINKKTIDTLI